MEAVPRSLVAALEEARAAGFLGPGPIEEHLRSGRGFAELLGPVTGPVLDLGSGGGVPGLVVAALLAEPQVILLESGHRRCRFLLAVVERLGLGGRVTVVEARAEAAGRDPRHRGGAGAVTARGFGPPATTAECAAPFLRVGGRLIVAEPPEGADRWPAPDLARLGLEDGGPREAGGRSFRVLTQVAACPDAFPRRVGVPRKRPLF